MLSRLYAVSMSRSFEKGPVSKHFVTLMHSSSDLNQNWFKVYLAPLFIKIFWRKWGVWRTGKIVPGDVTWNVNNGWSRFLTSSLVAHILKLSTANLTGLITTMCLTCTCTCRMITWLWKYSEVNDYDTSSGVEEVGHRSLSLCVLPQLLSLTDSASKSAMSIFCFLLSAYR